MGLLDELPDDWGEAISKIIDQKDLAETEKKLAKTNVTCPPRRDIFKAFRLCPLESVRVVILGQDPYTHGEATGLAFAVKHGKKISPSLRNIFRRIEASTGKSPLDTELEGWAGQGVLLLNSILTAEPGVGKAGSHRNWRWQKLTGAAIEAVKAKKDPVVFMVWGRLAENVVGEVSNPHVAMVTSHPSPKSFHKGFQTSDQFLRVANMLNDKSFWVGAKTDEKQSCS